MVVVQSEHGFTLIEFLGREGELSVDEEVRGGWDTEGGVSLRRDNDVFDVYSQRTWAAPQVLICIANGN
jgi:hypothetical protein